MEEMRPSLYEALVTEGLKAQLDELTDRLAGSQRALRSAEAADRIAWHLSRQVELALSEVRDDERVQVGLRVARALLDRLAELEELAEFVTVDRTAVPIQPATVLHAILSRRPDGSP